MLFEAILALVLALVVAGLLGVAFGVRGPWAAPWALFLVLFLLVWAGGAWITPMGPLLYDVYWMPFLLMAILLVLLFAASEGAPRPGARGERAEMRAEERAAEGVTLFFWILIVALAAAIVAAYV